MRVEPAVTTFDDFGIEGLEDQNVLIDASRLLANDVDGDLLSIAQVNDPVNGSVVLTSEGNVIFTPTTNFTGAASFTYTANLPSGGRFQHQQQTLRSCRKMMRRELLMTAGLTCLEGGVIFIDARDLITNDTDIDGDALALESVSNATGGSVLLNTFGDIVFTASPDFFGTATFEYTVSDGVGGTDTGLVSLNVTPVNDAPTVVDDTGFATDEDVTIGISVNDLLANDSDIDGRCANGFPRLWIFRRERSVAG